MTQKTKKLGLDNMYSFYCKNTKNPLPRDEFVNAMKQLNSWVIENILLKGEVYEFGFGLSGIRVVKFKNTYKKPKIDWGATKRAAKEGNRIVIYNTRTWKIWVQWYKKTKLKALNSTQYVFVTARQNKTHDRIKIKSLYSRIYEEYEKNDLFLTDLTTV